MSNNPITLPDVAQTGLLTLYCHAIESQNPDPILRDEKAVEISRQLDPLLAGSSNRFLRKLAKGGIRQNLVVHITLRAKKYDEYDGSFFRENPDGALVHIGCGMDSRFQRIDNGRLTCFDLDQSQHIWGIDGGRQGKSHFDISRKARIMMKECEHFVAVGGGCDQGLESLHSTRYSKRSKKMNPIRRFASLPGIRSARPGRSFLRITGLILLMLVWIVGVSQPALAGGAFSRPAAVDPSFVPMKLTAPDCSHGGLIKSVTATSEFSVTFELCRTDAAFISKLGLPSFAIYPQEWIESTSGDVNRTTEGLEHPIGTGPYRVNSWTRGDNLTLEKNPTYWGTAPQTNTLIFRWSDDTAARLLALQNATQDGIDAPSPEDYATIDADTSLQLVSRQNLNIFYLGMNHDFAGPFQDVQVRRAIAMAIDRQHIVDTYYPTGSVVATHFTPCAIPNGCSGTDWYAHDVTTAQGLMTAAGYPTGFTTNLYYRDVNRSYLPDPDGIAQEIHDQLLANLGIDATLVEMESGTFLEELVAGNLNGFHLLGWAADYSHVSNFLDYHFGQDNIQFGDPFSEIYTELNAAASLADPTAAAPYYTNANDAIRSMVPMVPMLHASTATAYRADVTNPQASPFGSNDYFANSKPGTRSLFRWMQTAEPSSLFCADESDSDSYRACVQIMDGLYNYEPNGGDTDPALAESCTPNLDATVYVCSLRQGVLFHDGSSLDANDVVETFAMGLDVSSPYHKGNSNLWEYHNFIFGLMDSAAHTISGKAGVGGAILHYVDAGSRTVTANANGYYSFMVSQGWSGTVTPSKAGYTFQPASKVYVNVTADVPNQNYIATTSRTFRSTSTQDGWMLESGENTNAGKTMNSTFTTLRLGDDAAKKQYRSLLSFATGAVLPDNAVITKVTLKVRRQGVVGGGVPVTIFQGFLLDIRKGTFGTAALQVTDWQAPAQKTIGPFKPALVLGWYTFDLTSVRGYINKLATLSGVTQMRLRFKLDDNNNLVANYLSLYSGNAPIASRPQLIIEYYVP